MHISVLYAEALAGLNIRPGGRYVDGTLGAGGHAGGMLEASAPDGLLLGIDLDRSAMALAAERLQPFAARYRLAQGNFAQMTELAASTWGWEAGEVDGVLLDLGLSSMQLDQGERGFSFRTDAPLDMRMNQSASGGPTAADLLADLDEEELANLLYEYGEETASRRVARRIVAARKEQPITTTAQLAGIVSDALGGKVAGRTRNPIHPATRSFQALRIAVNRELETLPQGLQAAMRLLKPGGRLAVISFHSLEDRAVKQFMQREAGGYVEGSIYAHERPATLRLLTRKPTVPSEQEGRDNPRARSAKLRVAEKI